MKVLKRSLIDQGINGSFSGTVEVKLNYREENKMVHNRGTHEEEPKRISYHIVIGYVKGERFESEEFQNENLVWQYIDEIEKKVKARLHILSKVPEVKPLIKQLEEKGYTEATP